MTRRYLGIFHLVQGVQTCRQVFELLYISNKDSPSQEYVDAVYTAILDPCLFKAISAHLDVHSPLNTLFLASLQVTCLHTIFHIVKNVRAVLVLQY